MIKTVENAGEVRRVAICGSYGGMNLGDEAILQVIVRELRESGSMDITVISRNASDTRRRLEVEAVDMTGLSRQEMRPLIQSLDLFILGGGGLLYDADAEMYLRHFASACDAGVPAMTYAISAGPLVDSQVRARVRDVLNRASLITVRDRQARQLLEEVGVEQEIELTADPALLLEPEPLTVDEILRAEAIDPQARLIGISVREPGPAAPELQVEHYHRLIANAADFMSDRFDADVVFFPMERRISDVQHSHGIVSQMHRAQRATVLKRDYTPGQLLSLLDHFDFAVGMRLHFLIFCALAGVPFVPLPYASKVTGFLEDLQLDVRRLEHISAGELSADIDRAWDARRELRVQIQNRTRELQMRARQTGQFALELLRHAHA